MEHGKWYKAAILKGKSMRFWKIVLLVTAAVGALAWAGWILNSCPRAPYGPLQQNQPVETEQRQTTLTRAFESAVSFSQSLSQWAYLTIAASLALIFKDFHEKAGRKWIRYTYLFFIPAWASLFASIWKGMSVHGDYISYLMMPQPNASSAILSVNADASCQLEAMKHGLEILAVWLVTYLLSLMVDQEAHKNESLNTP